MLFAESPRRLLWLVHSALFALLLSSTISVGQGAGGTGDSGEIPIDPAQTWIVVSEEKMDLGAQLARAIEEISGRRLEVVRDRDLEPEDWQGHHFIALGRFSNNAVILELYKNLLVFVDPIFPGPGGVHVKTVISPFHDGRHVLVLGGSDRDGTGRSVERFFELLGDAQMVVPHLHDFQSEQLPQAAPSPDRRREIFEQNVGFYQDSLGASTLARIVNYGMNYYFTLDEGWAELFRDQLVHFIEEAREREEWYWAPMLGLYFRAGQMLDAWALIEHSDFFSDTERQYIIDAFHDMTVDLLVEGTYLNERANPRGEPRQNHTSFAALSLDSSVRYFGRRGVDVSEWLEIVLPIFEGQLTTYRADDEGTYYSFYAQAHAFTFYAHRDMESVSRQGFLDKTADLALMVTDNLRNEITWGDVRTFVPFEEIAYQRYQGVVLGIASWLHGDPAHQWAYQWMNEGKQRPIGLQGWMSTLSYSPDHDPSLEPPERFLGLTHLLLDEGALQWVGPRVRQAAWMPEEGGRYLDKLTLRPSFDPQDEYLILSGLSALAHGHEDGNALLRITWKDRIWLGDLDYIRIHPRYNNSIVVSFDGKTDVLPPLATLAGHVESPDSALLQSRIENYTNTHWDRNIAWNVGDYFFIMDRLEATETGHYDLRKKWRLLGEEELSGNRLTLRQPGAEFHIVSGDSSSKGMLREAPGQSDWSRYPHASDGFRVYQQKQDEHAPAGQALWFADLMYAVAEGEEKHFDLLRIADSLWLILRDGEPHALAGSARGGHALGELHVDANVFHVTADRMDVLGLTSLSSPAGSFTSSEPVDMTIGRTGEGLLHLPASASHRVTGEWALEEAGDADAEPGRMVMRLRGPDAASLADSLAQHDSIARPIVPREPARPQAFGIDLLNSRSLGAAPSFSASLNGGDRHVGLTDGGLLTLRGLEDSAPGIDVGHEVRTVVSRDDVLFVGDDAAGISAYRNGEQLWHVELGVNRGRLEKLVKLGLIETARGPRLVAVTEGWRVHCYTLDGVEEWMEHFKYHAATELELADVTGDGRTEIIVGNEYITPVHVFDDEGTSLWHAWEQVGSESHSTTEFLGIHAHSLDYTQLIPEEGAGLLLGNGTDEVIFLDGADGAVHWRANVGGEAWHLHAVDWTGTGGKEVLVATGAGSLVMLNALGERLWHRNLTGPANAADVYHSSRVNEHLVAVGTEAGELVVYDGRGNVLARAYDDEAIEHVHFVEEEDRVLLYSISLGGEMREWEFRYPRSAYPPHYRTDRHRF